MSLVNDMLRELEQRRGQPDMAIAGVRPAAVTKRSGSRGIVVLALLSMTAGAALLGYHGWDRELHQRDDQLAAVTETTPSVASIDERAVRVPNAPGDSMGATALPAVAAATPATLRLYRLDYHLARKPTLRPHRPDPINQTAPARSAEAAAAQATTSTGRVEIRRDTDFRQQGLRALRAGRPTQAETAFRQLTLQDPAGPEGYLLLSQALVAQSRPGAALAVLRDALLQVDQPARIAAALAHQLLERGDVGAALQVLEPHRDSAGADLHFQALLAATYERSGDYKEAADRYSYLVTRQPEHGAWWVGLGIAHEALGAAEEARLAYDAARGVTLEAPLAEYVQQRLAALGVQQ